MSSLIRKAIDLYRDARIGRLGPRPGWQTIGRGLEMEIDPADWMDRAFFLGTYDRALVTLLKERLRAGDHCLDVGAHKGYISLLMAREVGPHGRVFSFEPDPRAREALERNCARNRMDQVSVLPWALGDVDERRGLAISRQIGWSSFSPNPQAAATVLERLSVEVRTLDRLLFDGALALDPQRLAFVKIDAEGAEPRVLAGMRNLLKHARPMLWIEVNRESLASGGFTPEAIEGPLVEAGYRLFVPQYTNRMMSPRVILEPSVAIRAHALPIFDIAAIK